VNIPDLDLKHLMIIKATMSKQQLGQATEDQRMEVEIVSRIAPGLMTRA